MNKTLMVAGCSFSAVSRTHPGTAWSELLVQRLGWNLINLARQGCSNGGVRIQIEEIRRQRPDFAIIGPTFWDRMEIPATAAPYDWQRPSGGWNPALEQHLQDRNLQNGYDRSAGIDNVNYGTNNYRMICETIFSLAENYPNQFRKGLIDRATQTAVKHYIDCLYDSNWKKQQDEWIIVEGLLQMYHDGLNFFVMPNLLWPFDGTQPDLWRQAIPAVIPDRCIALDPMRTPQVACGQHPVQEVDPGYHGSEQSQVLIADWWYEKITSEFDLI